MSLKVSPMPSKPPTKVIHYAPQVLYAPSKAPICHQAPYSLPQQPIRNERASLGENCALAAN